MSQNPVLIEIGRKYHKTVFQVALRFLTQRGISVIPKSRRKERLIENINIFDFKLTTKEMEKIKDLDQDETLFMWTKYL